MSSKNGGSDSLQDSISIKLISSFEQRSDGSTVFNGIWYDECSRCRATVIRLKHYMTGNRIDVDPLPVFDGYVVPDFDAGTCILVPGKQEPLYRNQSRWQPHVVSCGGSS